VRRVIRIISSVLIIAGGLLLLDAGLTVAWQEPVSAVYGHINQNKLNGQLKKIEAAPLPVVEQKALKALPDPTRKIAFLARSQRRHAKDGEAIGKIQIPRIGANYVVVNGTDAADLRKGPGLYEQTPFPGAGGTTAIAGHRTTYAAPFRKVNQLKKGNRVIVTMPYGRFTYTVERLQIVPPTALWVISRVSYDRLVLSACHPLYSAAKRIIRGTVEYGISNALHEDDRYCVSGQTGFWNRTKYAVSSTFLARRVNGDRTLAVARFGGIASAAFVSNIWQPSSTSGMNHAGTSIGFSIAANAGSNVLREFWPDLKNKFRRK